jgi:hypothetical protein
MSWKDKCKEFGGGNFSFLSMDGESINFIVVADPVALKSVYKGKEQDRIGCPIVTDDGFTLLITGKRVLRKLSKLEDKFDSHVINITRHGVEGDVNATYQITVLDDSDYYNRLNNIASETDIEQEISDAIKDSKEAMKN